MWWHTRRNQIWSSSETDESIYIGGGVSSRLLAAEVCASAVVMLDRECSDTVQDCWLPTPFASFPFISPPVLRRVPPDSVSTLHTRNMLKKTNKNRMLVKMTSPLYKNLNQVRSEACHRRANLLRVCFWTLNNHVIYCRVQISVRAIKWHLPVGLKYERSM